ncbi:hypothetical protein BDB00DRAFT_873073 [Zychaea mexicana]|uniref:uncharacterized protein n=1 Tax=Zychaea mexicana TaxID=64656 RepID=UPI0022FF09D4|nr:uncharacterized protein BDB00DRAFT_873073 [Zychaea mexicana]KAI9492854.1 hypothetical protein BDB00DRAFT_873073 [Zychaea mexicana]
MSLECGLRLLLSSRFPNLGHSSTGTRDSAGDHWFPRVSLECGLRLLLSSKAILRQEQGTLLAIIGFQYVLRSEVVLHVTILSRLAVSLEARVLGVWFASAVVIKGHSSTRTRDSAGDHWFPRMSLECGLRLLLSSKAILRQEQGTLLAIIGFQYVLPSEVVLHAILRQEQGTLLAIIGFQYVLPSEVVLHVTILSRLAVSLEARVLGVWFASAVVIKGHSSLGQGTLLAIIGFQYVLPSEVVLHVTILSRLAVSLEARVLGVWFASAVVIKGHSSLGQGTLLAIIGFQYVLPSEVVLHVTILSRLAVSLEARVLGVWFASAVVIKGQGTLLAIIGFQYVLQVRCIARNDIIATCCITGSACPWSVAILRQEQGTLLAIIGFQYVLPSEVVLHVTILSRLAVSLEARVLGVWFASAVVIKGHSSTGTRDSAGDHWFPVCAPSEVVLHVTILSRLAVSLEAHVLGVWFASAVVIKGQGTLLAIIGFQYVLPSEVVLHVTILSRLAVSLEAHVLGVWFASAVVIKGQGTLLAIIGFQYVLPSEVVLHVTILSRLAVSLEARVLGVWFASAVVIKGHSSTGTRDSAGDHWFPVCAPE